MFPALPVSGAGGGAAGASGIESGRERIDNISDTALRAFRVRYNDNTITKDAIFDYVYGVLHASAYRERFANDLAKELPRIPLAPDFHAFAKADVNSRNFISVTKPVKSIRWRSRSRTPETHRRRIPDWRPGHAIC